MKFKKTIRGMCAALSCTLLLTSPALAAAMGTELDGYTLPVREGTEYTHGVYWTGTDYRRENYIEYSPNDQVYPMVVYGSKLLNYGNFASMAKLLNSEGYYVIGGINGDFYNTWDYQPLGVVIKNGKLITTDGGFVAVGFKADGSAMIGRPGIVAKAAFSGETYQLSSINKARQTGYALYTSDYAAQTRNSEPGWDIILSMPEDGLLTADCTLELTVDEIIESEERCDIPEGKLLLSLPKSTDDWRKKGVENLSVGDTVSLTVTCNEGWDEVVTGLGTLYQILEDGEIVSDLPTGAEPRTAIGLREDGSVVFYTVDGRKSGHSVGATMSGVAERLLELGCVDAVMMDGGGSTTMNMVLPGESGISQINLPSDGTQRSVTNYLMLVSTTPPTGEAERLVLSPYSSRMLLGAKTELTTLAVDSVGFAAEVPDDVRYSSDLGSFDGDTFTAGRAGEGSISVSADELERGEARLLVVDTPDSITVKEEKSGAARASITLTTEESLDLTASAMFDHLPLTVQDTCFEWAVEGEIGEIDENGLFTAAEAPAEGAITVTAGENTVTIPVKISYPAGVYSDVQEGAWYADAVLSMGQNGYMTGVTETEFAPDAQMTRAMLVTLLHRLENSPAPEAAAPFEDVEGGKWYSDAVAWASENGLVTGYDEKTFGIADSITREQMAALLCRYAAWKGDDVTSDQSLDVFSDRDSISPYAVDAVKWCVQQELIRGLTDTSFAPQGTATRAQTAVLLDRYLSE
ncbi:MAG: phosphodiester glycosidase family protein [Candidatus Heteroscillospira sp.]|jgi:hypothetical protein